MSGKGGIGKENPRKVADHGKRKAGCTRTCVFGLPRRWELVSPVKYLKHFGGKVAAAVVRLTSSAAPAKSQRNNNPPPKTSVAPVDSQRAEAIHDCIDFINSSSSMPRSNSVAR